MTCDSGSVCNVVILLWNFFEVTPVAYVCLINGIAWTRSWWNISQNSSASGLFCNILELLYSVFGFSRISDVTVCYVWLRSLCHISLRHAIAQAVRRQLLTAEVRVHSQGGLCRIFGGQSVSAADFSRTSSVSYRSTNVLFSHLIMRAVLWACLRPKYQGTQSQFTLLSLFFCVMLYCQVIARLRGRYLAH